ncbi:PREDICTED: ribosomal L1 domain-containing protein 1 [Gekko japonicus]|uniref:Ribosomal L1 domain-containing protein 1 n=1 Tax=Gekko japonicus TaxID=146911 RepID=A0ABM1KB95_GEKJA|nr:PREDICTED: ribosomal L1 domain-containing protein 1 [Gekko japonicus]
MAGADTAVPLDGVKIKKAAHALLAYNKTRQKTSEKLLLNEDLNVFLMVTVWKIPPREQVVKITLPHGILPSASEVCLFTKDEPGLTAEQSENMYRKLLSQHGVTNIAEVISYKTLKKEYKSFESKRRLLNRFSLFLSDDRIRRLLPSHIGKHFYRSKKAPLSVNLKAKNLAKEINRRIQGTVLPVTNKGCCYTARVGHTGMTAEEIVGNVVAVVTVLAAKAPKIFRSIKILHLKTDKSIALPIFNRSYPGSGKIQQTGAEERKKNNKKKKNQKNKSKGQTPVKSRELVEGSDVLAPGSLKGEVEETAEISGVVGPEQEDNEVIPLLVPIEMVAEPSPSAKKGMEMDPKGHLQGKRKLSVSSMASITGMEIPKGVSSQKTPKQLKQGKKAKAPKQLGMGKELLETPLKPKPKSSVNLKRKKGVMSAKKAPRTPEQRVGKSELLQSV